MSSCMLCAAESTRLVYRVQGTDVVSCTECGLVWTAGLPSEEDLAGLYDEAYFTGESEYGVDYVGDPRVQAYDRARFGDTLDLLESDASAGRRLLDVGCATGHFLLAARERGWKVSGCELSPEAAHFAADSHDLEVFVGSPARTGCPEGSFDVVTMNHVLEHVPAPDRYLREEIASLLAPEGLLLVEVPNFDSIHSRVNGSTWADLRPEQHRFHFTPTTLSRLLEKSGYQPIRIVTLPEPQISILGPLVYLHVRQRPQRPVQGGAMGKAGSDSNAGEHVRSALRRLARFISMPCARYYAHRLMELRLVVVARRAESDVH